MADLAIPSSVHEDLDQLAAAAAFEALVAHPSEPRGVYPLVTRTHGKVLVLHGRVVQFTDWKAGWEEINGIRRRLRLLGVEELACRVSVNPGQQGVDAYAILLRPSPRVPLKWIINALDDVVARSAAKMTAVS
jgi:hypothetical protein